jgi:hypothetical protein
MKKLDDHNQPDLEPIIALRVTLRTNNYMDEVTIVTPMYAEREQAEINGCEAGFGAALEKAILTGLVYLPDETSIGDCNFNVELIDSHAPFNPTLEDKLKLSRALQKANKLPVGQA